MKTVKNIRNKAMTISVSPELFDKIEILSKQSGVSKSAYVSVLVAESIRQKDIINTALDNFPTQLADKMKEIFESKTESDSLS